MSGVVFQAHTKTKAKAKPKGKTQNRYGNNYNSSKKSGETTSNKKNDGWDYGEQISEKIALKDIVNHRFSVLGVDIEFPFPPYNIQKAMMNKVILALSNKQHCLIESPTGTGKTLVLLCSVLAWQRKSFNILHPFVSKKYREKLRETRKDSKSNIDKPCTCGRRPNYKLKKIDDDFQFDDEVCLKKPRLSDSPPVVQAIDIDETVIEFEDDDDCKIVEANDKETHATDFNISSKETSKEASTQCTKTEMCSSCLALEAEKTYLDLCGEDSQDGCSASDGVEAAVDIEMRKCKIPKIYYGAKTHKQIAQVIREVNKTDYRSRINMTILSSRDRTCINEEVKSLSTRNDKCRELINNARDEKSIKPTCQYYQDNQTREMNFLAMQEHFNDRAFDIEDAANFGKQHRSCPFYGMRATQSKVDITFCPYNYILDPTIRLAMKINLKNSIIILDEAHNIEDTCRDSASFNITSKHIEDISESIRVSLHQNAPSNQGLYEALHFFKNLLMHIEMWMRRQQFDQKFDGNDSDWSKSINYEGATMISTLESVDLGQARMEQLKTNLNNLKGSDDPEDLAKIRDQPALNGNQMQVIQKLVLAMEYMYSEDLKYLNSYKLVLTRSIEREPQNRLKDLNAPDQGPKYIYEMNLFCMSPAVAFGTVRDQAWSIIVASGTLSPLESLKTELGTAFGCTFEGMHVIRKEQIFATVIHKGPSGLELNFSWQPSQQLNLQDEVGLIVLDVCKKVPNGVLCFFPSYDRMDKLYKRWFQKGFIGQIRKAGKSIHQEKKELTLDEFDIDLQEYNKNAEDNGAILFAVFRGKVSEGIDFADKAARAVITIGIPFPNLKDANVNLKKKYNDETRRSTPTIMTGNDWYSSQGFRALNQGLGRCIRHQNDWGAILMIDSRLKRDNNFANLSKWVRQLAHVNNSYKEVSDGLERFVTSRISIDENQSI